MGSATVHRSQAHALMAANLIDSAVAALWPMDSTGDLQAEGRAGLVHGMASPTDLVVAILVPKDFHERLSGVDGAVRDARCIQVPRCLV